MTRHLASQRIFKDKPFVLMDIGAREGLKSHWEAFFPDIAVIAFELDPSQCPQVCQMLLDCGCTDIQTHTDLAGLSRVVSARFQPAS